MARCKQRCLAWVDSLSRYQLSKSSAQKLGGVNYLRKNMTKEAPVISCRNVWKLFGNKPREYLASMPESHTYDDISADGYIAGVKDVTVEVNRGEMLVIMGLSGSGKSTLVRCFSRLHEITGGIVEVEGQDIQSLSEKELIDLRRNKMGMVFQSFGLLPHRTILENVAFPLEMRGQDKHTRRCLLYTSPSPRD